MVWVQEEPANMGSWTFLMHQCMENWGEIKWKYIGRQSSASPATGYKKLHLHEQSSIINQALNIAE